VLNYGRTFFKCTGEKWDTPQVAMKRVFKFVDAAKKSGWLIEAFIDAATVTNEAINKWKSRREKEVKNEERAMPQGCQSLLGDMFKRAGVRVHYSLEADCDDTIVSYAYATGAAVLSKYSDMFRYNCKLEIYSVFNYSKGFLVLIPPKIQTRKLSTSRREIISPPPATFDRNPGFIQLDHSRQYIRGSPSPLTRQFGNLHLTVRPLRQAAYHRLGVKESIKEEFPIWSESEQKVVWKLEEVSSDDRFGFSIRETTRSTEFFLSLSYKTFHG